MFEVRHLEVHEHELLLPMLGAMYPSVSDSDLATRLDTIADSAWQCVGAFSSGRLIGLAGSWVNTRF